MNTLFEFLVIGSLYVFISGVLIISVRALMLKLNSSKVAVYKLWLLFLVGFVLLLGFQQIKPDVAFTQDIEQIIQLPTITAISNFSGSGHIQYRSLSWETAAMMVWALVSLFLILRLVLRYRKFKKSLIYTPSCLDNNVVESKYVSSPVAFGIRNPQIFVPVGYQQSFTPCQQNLLMQHEQVHCDRKDPLILMLYKVLTHVFWFHPIAYVLNDFMKKDQEISCDEIVLNGNKHSVEYSKLLFQLNQLTHDNNNNPALYCSSISMLKERIMLIKNLQPKSFINGLISHSVLLISAIGLVTTTTALANIVKPHTTTTVNPPIAPEIKIVSQQPTQAPKPPISKSSVAPTQPVNPPKVKPVEKINTTKIKAPKPPKIPKVEKVKIVPISQPAPYYPREAAVNKISGYVIVEFDIVPDGTVENLKVIESKPETLFNKEALRSVKKYQFKPITEKTRVRQRVDFSLTDGKTTISENSKLQTSKQSKIIPISRPEPIYPRIYQHCGVGGYVDVEYEVLQNGTVGKIKVIYSNPKTPFFKKPAIRSVKKYQFEPIAQTTIVTQRIEFKQEVKHTVCPPITSNYNGFLKSFGRPIKQVAKK